MFDQLVDVLQKNNVRLEEEEDSRLPRGERNTSQNINRRVLDFIRKNPGVPTRLVFERVDSTGYNNICSSVSYLERIGKLRSEMRLADPKWVRRIPVMKHYWAV